MNVDRIRAARVLGERRVVEIERARVGIEDDVLENRAEAARRLVDLRLGLAARA